MDARINSLLNLSIFVTNSYLNSYDFSEWTSITDSQISSLFTSYNNKTNLKDSIVKLALELIEAVPAKASVISNALYTTLGTSSATNITNAKLVDLAKTHIFDTTKLGTIRNKTSTKTSNDIEIYKGLRTVSLRKNRQEFTSDAFIQTVKDISNNDDDNLVEDFILDLNADLSLNLQGFDLCGVDLTGIDLKNANLKDTDLSGANLTNSILNNTDLSGANLTNTNLNNSKAKNVSNTTTTTGTATNLPYSLKYYKNNLRLITEDLTTGSISTSENSIGPFTEGQTIIVNGVQVIIGKGVTDAGLVNADQDRNGDSFTFLKKDNKVATWGNKVRGGNITLDISNVKQVYANNHSKVVLSKRGTLYAWGDSRYGATVPTDISGVIDVFPNEKAYTALHVDGTVSCWGDSTTGGTAPTDLSGVVNVFNNQQAFTALLSDGGVVSWGKTTGSYPTSKNFIKVYSTLDSFAGLKSDGTVESWGSKYPSLNTPPTDLSNVAIIYQNDRAYAALLANGTVQAWGHVDYGGKSNVSSLTNIKKIYNNDHAFCALSYSGSLSCWGNTSYGGTLPTAISDAVEVYATSTAFTAKRTNNEIYSWGEASNGGTTPTEETKVEKRKTIILNDRGGVVIKDNDDIVQFGINEDGNETYNFGFRFNRLITNVKKVVYNENAFAVLKKDGTVVVWGRETAGGDASTVQSNLTDIVDIYPNRYSFVAINSSYNLYGWGGTGGNYQIANLDATITDVSSVVVNHSGYAFLQKNGDVSIAGSATTSADLTSVTKIYANYNAYAAIKSDGSVVTWGTGTSGGDSSSVSSNLTNVVEIYPSYGAFAAVKSDGSVVTWGHTSYGSDSSSVSGSLTSGVSKIFSTERAFAALKSDGSIVTWGDSNYGGSSSSVSSNLTSGVEKIFKTERAFAALKSDGSVYSWGNSSYGGTTPGLTNVSTIIPNKQTFVALKTDNTVSAWGNSSYGSDLAHSSLGIRDHQTDTVNTSLNQNITKVVASERAFAAIKSDGSIVTWGTHQYGGSLHSSTYGVVANGGTLSSFSKKAIEIISSANNFIVLFEDFTISGWGSKLDFGKASEYLLNIEKPTLEKDHEETVSAFNNKNINYGRTYFASSRVNLFETTTTATKYIDKIYSTDSAFAGHKQDGTVVVWGNSNFGGDSSSVSSLSTVSQIISTRGAFMAKKQDGTHFFWGNSNFGGFSSPANSLAISNKLQDINFYCSSYRKNNLRALYDINRDTRSLEKLAVTVNNSANAQINVDGSITAWGNSSHGGTTTSVNAELINTKTVVSGENTFVSLRSDGQLKAWKTSGITMSGSDYKKVVSGLGGDTLALKKDGTMVEFKQNSWSTVYSFTNETESVSLPTDIIDIYAFNKTFAAIDKNNALYIWGDNSNLLTNISNKSSDISSNICEVYANDYVLVAKTFDNTLITIGKAENGGNIDATDNQYKLYGGTATDIDEVYLNDMFAVALKTDDTCIYWGDISRNTTLFESDITKFTNIRQVISSKDVTIAININGKVFGLGEKSKGASIPSTLTSGVSKIYSATLNGFAALKYDNSIIGWGEDASFNYTLASTNENGFRDISGEIVNIYSNDGAFTALKRNGTVLCWGKTNYGSTAPTDISNVTDIIPGPDTFTAVVNNHTTITWGNTSTGSTIYNYNNNLRYSQVLNRTFSNSNKLNTVLNNNYKVTTAYIHNNNDININKIQIRSAEETRILDNFNLRSYNSMRSIIIPTNLQVNSNTMVNLGINTDAKRHMVLDNIFSNSTETSLITSSYGLNLNKRLNKTNVKVLAANTSTEMDLTSTSTQITNTQGAYANLSDLSDNVTVNLDDNNKFKVTRTTAKTATGKYIITCVLGTITMVKGIYTNIYTQNQSSYECSDGDEVYINKVKFTFGGFGTDGINHSQKDAYLPIVYNDRVICYLSSNGKVSTIGTTSDHGAYPYKGDHSIMKNSFYTDVSGGVIQVVSTKKGFAALKSDGTVRSWGHTLYNSMNGINTFADSILHLNYDIIKLFSNENYYVALKKNRDVITWGYIAAKNGQGRIFSYLNNSIYNSFSDPIKPFKNVFKVIMNNYATALLTYDNEVITFGDHRHGGDYNDFLYGINGRQNTFITDDVHTGVLTNVKKVIGLSRNSTNDNSGFAALKKDGSVVFWGSIKYSIVSNQTDINDLSNNIIDIEPLIDGFYIKYSNQSIKVITCHNITSSSTPFSSISSDISKNIIQIVSNSQAAAFLRSDNTLFLLGSNSYGAVLSSTYYLDTDRTDIVNDYTLNNVQKVFASQRGFAALKTNGSVVCWGYNSTSSSEDNNNAIVNIYGGNLVNIKHIHSNMFAWCAVKHDGTIVTWTNSNDVAKFGGNFIDSEYGVNSTSFGGDGLATTFINGKIERNGVISVKEVVPVRKQGFVAIVNDSDQEENLLLWGLPNYIVTKAQIDACNSHTETVHGLSNTYPVNYYDFKHIVNNDANYGNERFANYEKFIDVSLNSNSKFVFNNDPSTNPILDKTLNYTFTVPSSLISGTGFKILNTPYSTNTTLIPTQFDSSNYKLETTLNNKYYLFSSNSGISTGSLYNDSTITTDISEGQIVETIYNSSTKNSFSNYNTLGNNNLIPDASLNIIAYTNYKDRGAILDLIHKSLNIKHTFVTTNLTSLDITKSSINFHKMLYYSETLHVYDTDTFIDLSSNSSVSNCFIGNLAKTQNKITLKTQHATFEIEKTNDVSGSERFIVRCLKGQIEINTSATNYTLTNKSKILTNSNFNDISLNYFIKDDYVLINDIEFLITSYGFITNGDKIKYKEIIVTQNSEGTYLFNNLTTPPSIEYGENYKFITNNVLFKNKPFYLTKSTF